MSMISNQHHLATPDDFSDNCGFGLIAHIEGDASHDLVKTAIHSLSCMTHRGGVAADGKTGDGCGLLLAKPVDFFKEIASELNFSLADSFAVGTVFVIWMKKKPSTVRQYWMKSLLLRGLWSLAGERCR